MPKILSLLSVAVVLLCCNGCTHAQRPARRTAAPTRSAPKFVNALPDTSRFFSMAGAPLSARYNDVASVKVVLSLRDGRLYFINTAYYRFHYNFCSEALGYGGGIPEFNEDNYGNAAARQYCLANLNYYRQSRYSTLEFVSEDEISASHLQMIYNAARAFGPFRDSLRLLVSSDHLMRLEAAGRLRMPRIHPSAIYAGQLYQVLNGGRARGRLRIIRDLGKEYNSVQPGDIIVTRGTPLRLPVCAGVVTDAFQTPLSHINILCHSRNIPAAVSRDILKSATGLDGKIIVLSVGKDKLELEPADDQTPPIANSQNKAQEITKLQFDLRTAHTPGIREVTVKMSNVVGNKAAGFGALAVLASNPKSAFSVPEGAFAIPFYFYQQHIQQPRISREISALLDHPALSVDDRNKQLMQIREAIRNAPVDSLLIAEVVARMRAGNCGNSFRFRSSSNAEDRIGFSGAGLYESKTGVLGNNQKSVDKAIKSVWASIWDEAPYEERSFYHIDHRTAMMGVLCHRNFPDEAANGVAITRNIYRNQFPGYTVNVQSGEESVVSPEDGVTCEQFVSLTGELINPSNQEVVTDYITFSSLTRGKPVLDHRQVVRLHTALDQIKLHFFNTRAYGREADFADFALDVEFKFDRNGKLYIKQVRPYR